MNHFPDIYCITFNEANAFTPHKAFPLAPHSVLKAMTSSEVLLLAEALVYVRRLFIR